MTEQAKHAARLRAIQLIRDVYVEANRALDEFAAGKDQAARTRIACVRGHLEQALRLLQTALPPAEGG